MEKLEQLLNKNIFQKTRLKFINKNEFQKLKFNIKNYYKEDTEKLEKIKLEYNFRKNDYI